MDLSFVRSMNEHAECIYLCDIYPKLYRATALDLSDAPSAAEIYPMSDIRGMSSFGDAVPMERCYVINRISNHPFHPSNILLQYKLLRFILELNPDVIHFNNLIYFNHFYLFLFRTSVIISIHDPFPHSGEESDALSLSSRIYRFLNKKLVRKHLLYNDTMVEAYARSRGISRDRIITSRLGPYDYLRSIRGGVIANQCDFLFFGRIQKYKGIDLLLEAFKLVLEKAPGARLLIAGSGSFWFDIESYAIPAENLVVCNRFIPGSELADMIEAASVVVCPYRDATQSGVVMSAYAFCKPVIVTDVGALREVVEDGTTGRIVPPNDANALSLAMLDFLHGESSHRNWHGSIHRHFYEQEGSWNHITSKLIVKYRNALGNHDDE
jgi:glycosyltransferase involved in cell wall biosynthesis